MRGSICSVSYFGCELLTGTIICVVNLNTFAKESILGVNVSLQGEEVDIILGVDCGLVAGGRGCGDSSLVLRLTVGRTANGAVLFPCLELYASDGHTRLSAKRKSGEGDESLYLLDMECQSELVITNRGELHLDEKLRRYPAGVVREDLVVVVGLSNCRVVG
jgi:hypothetical protein